MSRLERFSMLMQFAGAVLQERTRPLDYPGRQIRVARPPTRAKSVAERLTRASAVLAIGASATDCSSQGHLAIQT